MREEKRQKKHTEYPSRMGCLYVSETLDEAEKWGYYLSNGGDPLTQLLN